VISVQKISEDKFVIYIKPNSSLTGFHRLFFISSIAFICLGIAVVFYFIGAILILAFYLNFRWSSKREKIYISQEKVIIEKGINKAEYRWEEFRTFTSFQVSKDINKLLKLSFRSKGNDVLVGEFLNEEDKIDLKNEISKIIEVLNS
jgi:uncharacterized membrane protein